MSRRTKCNLQTAWSSSNKKASENSGRRKFQSHRTPGRWDFAVPPEILAAEHELTNWAGNLKYGTERLYTATSHEDVQRFVKTNSQFKVLGTRHCFNEIANTASQFLSLRSQDKVVGLDAQARTVTIEAGMSYGQLCP